MHDIHNSIPSSSRLLLSGAHNVTASCYSNVQCDQPPDIVRSNVTSLNHRLHRNG